MRNELIYGNMILLFVCIERYPGDIALRHVETSNKHIFGPAPKVWHAYTEMLITKLLDCNNYSFRLFTNLFFNMMRYVERFEKLNARKNIIFNITQVVTYFSLLQISDSATILQLFMFVDRILAPNITMVSLHFYIGVDNCQLEHLKVINFKENRMRYLYCGHHPVFNFYPEFNHLMLKSNLLYRTPFELKAIFSVTDKNTVVSKQMLPFLIRKNHASIIPLFAYKLEVMYISSFLIKVNVLFRVVVFISSKSFQKHVVYDGPGYMNDILEKNLRETGFIVYTASTFQCTLVVRDHAIPDIIKVVNFERKRHSQEITIKLPEHSNISLYLPNKTCKTHICVIRFKTAKSLNINLTINEILGEYIFHSHCLFAGFSNVIISRYLFTTTLCGNSRHLKEPSRSFYSIINLLFVSWYTYPSTSSLTVSFTVSTTKCMAARLDPCKLKFTCGPFQDRNCRFYLDKHFRFDIGTVSSKGLHNEFHVSIPDKKCVILQLGNWHYANLYQHLVHLAPAHRRAILSSIRKNTCVLPLIIKQGKITNLKGSLNIFWKYSHILRHNYILITSAIDCVDRPSLCPYSLNKKTISRIAYLVRMKGINNSVLEILQNIKSLYIHMLWSRLKYDWVEIHLISPHNRTDGVQYSVIIQTLTSGNMIPYYISTILKPTGKLGTKFLLKIYNPRLKNIFSNRTLLQLKIGRYISSKEIGGEIGK